VADDASIKLNKQMEEATASITEEDTNVLDPSFEDVLAAAEARIDEEASESSEESDDSESSDDTTQDSNDKSEE
jgi:hypothetical protein